MKYKVLLMLILVHYSDCIIGQSQGRMIGSKSFQLGNHLENIVTVVSDRKVNQVSTDGITIAVTDSDVLTISDYYPYGMLMEGRTSTSNYRFGFQGQEQDDEVRGEGNSINYTYRMHDPRLGRFFMLDPLAESYPQRTPFNFAGNTPIVAIEVDGLEPKPGDKNYGKHFIFASRSVYQDMSSKDDESNANWMIRQIRTFQDANTEIKKISAGDSNFKISTLYLTMHGASNGTISQIPGGPGANSEGEYTLGSAHSKNDVWLQNSDLKMYLYLQENGEEAFLNEYGKQKGNTWIENEYVAIKDLVELTENIEDGGTLVLGACQVGRSSEFMELLFEVTGSRLEIYAAQSNVTVSGMSGSLTLLGKNLTRDDELGWKVVSPKTEGVATSLSELNGNDVDKIILQKSGDPIINEDEDN